MVEEVEGGGGGRWRRWMVEEVEGGGGGWWRRWKVVKWKVEETDGGGAGRGNSTVDRMRASQERRERVTAFSLG